MSCRNPVTTVFPRSMSCQRARGNSLALQRNRCCILGLMSNPKHVYYTDLYDFSSPMKQVMGIPHSPGALVRGGQAGGGGGGGQKDVAGGVGVMQSKHSGRT